MVNLNIRVKQFAMPESGERKRNLTTLVLVKRAAVKRGRSRQKVSESSQNPLKWSCTAGKIFALEGACLDSGKRSGGVAILVPPGWKVERAHELVPAKGLALLIRDRSTQFYLVSVYLHPESKKRDLEKLMQEWARLEKDTARVIFVGDFNRIDETHSALWNSFLAATSCVDVDPKLITYYTQEVSSPLDLCLLPAEWMR